MEFIRLSLSRKNEIIDKALLCLDKGGILAFPTETFYGLGAKYDNEPALLRLYELKKRPFEKAIPVIIGRIEHIHLLTDNIPSEAERLMEKYWPGPLTIIFQARTDLSPYLTAGTEKIAVRMPGESFALELARKADFPITATSANPSGAPPAVDAQEVLKYFGESLDMIIDAGQTPGISPSTIVEVINGKPKVLRKGVIEKVSLD